MTPLNNYWSFVFVFRARGCYSNIIYGIILYYANTILYVRYTIRIITD